MNSNLNRLNLDWKLTTREERNTYIKTYIDEISFNPTEAELDMMAKYILWGTNTEGLNGRQEGLDLPTRSHIWDTSNTEIESLDALLESPTFNETVIRKPEDPIFRTPKIKLDRSQIRKQATDSLREHFEDLWTEIDSLELQLNLYELAHDKRKIPIRKTLLDKFTEEEIHNFEELSKHFTPFIYLKKKRLLVEMRRQQYSLKDGYSDSFLLRPTFNTFAPSKLIWDLDIIVKPLGLPFDSKISKLVFRKDRFPEPQDFKEEDLKELSKFLWDNKKSNLEFDFTNIEHISKFASLKEEIEEQIERDKYEKDVESTLPQLLQGWEVYSSLAPLKDFQRKILDMKIKHYSNEKIVQEIEKEFEKHYTLNYISTMYCKTILPCIADTARRHREVCENLFWPENFKKCIDCGQVLLRDGENFVKKSRSSDGFSPRCKKCEKKLRDSKKENK